MSPDTFTSASLGAQLERAGWSAVGGSAPRQLVLRTFQGVQPAQLKWFEGRGGLRLLVIVLERVHLPSAESLFARFLDVPLELRMALAWARASSDEALLLFVTERRADLLALPSEQSLARVDSPEELEEAMLPMLAGLARGRPPAALSAQAFSESATLRDWFRQWALLLARELEVGEDEAGQMLWKWIVMLQHARRQPGAELAGGWGLSATRDPEATEIRFDATTAVADLWQQLIEFDRLCPSGYFTPCQELADGAGAPLATRFHQLDETSLLDRLRAELLMQSQQHFEPETVAWLFTEFEVEQLGWRREMAGLAAVQQRFGHDGWTILDPLRCDVSELGLTFALHEADRLANHLNDVDHFIRQRAEAGEAQVGQPDLFCQQPRGIGTDGALEDGLTYLYGEALRLEGVPGGRRFGFVLVFLLKGLQIAERLGWPVTRLDAIDDLLG